MPLQAAQYTSIKKTKNLSEIRAVIPQRGQILLYSEFVNPNSFIRHEFFPMIQAQLGGSDYEMAFVGRGSYQTPKSINQLSIGFFHNIQNIQYLLGSDYLIQPIDENVNNFVFQSSRNLPFGNSLIGTVSMQTLEANQASADLLFNIQSITGRAAQPQRIVVQDMSGFNNYVYIVRMVTALYANPDGTTDVEVLSVSVFDDFPSFGSSIIESNSEQDLRGYAERLFSLR